GVGGEVTAEGIQPPMTVAVEETHFVGEALAQLALLEEARLGAEIIGRALIYWDKLVLRDLGPSP
ncbi:hypothetical protein U1Q18_046624, partial [Sarracenia purpurea var. burkii]